MNKIFQSALVAILSIYSTHVFAEGTTINYRLASADETRKLMQGNTEYYAKMNQMDIDWRVRKEGSTLAELQTMAWQQTRDWTDAEREFMATIVGMITDSLNSIGCQLPVPSEIVFAKTTQAEEGGSAGYTIKNIIFLNETYLGMCLPNAEIRLVQEYDVLDGISCRTAFFGLGGFGEYNLGGYGQLATDAVQAVGNHTYDGSHKFTFGIGPVARLLPGHRLQFGECTTLFSYSPVDIHLVHLGVVLGVALHQFTCLVGRG